MSGIGDAPHHPTACGCGRCLGKTRLEVEQDALGEQAPSAEEVEIHALRVRVCELEALLREVAGYLGPFDHRLMFDIITQAVGAKP